MISGKDFSSRRQARNRLLLHNKHAAHRLPVAWKGANIRILAGGHWCAEVEDVLLASIDDRYVIKNSVELGHILFLASIGIV